MRIGVAIGSFANPPGFLLGEGVYKVAARIPKVAGCLDGCPMPVTGGAKLHKDGHFYGLILDSICHHGLFLLMFKATIRAMGLI